MYYNVREKGYQKLEVWKKANSFVFLVYKITRHFPRNEEFGLTSQLRRSALSIATNIVEGQASLSKREFLNFLNIANRSLVETEYLLEVASGLGYLSQSNYGELDKFRHEIGVLLNGLTRSIRVRL